MYITHIELTNRCNLKCFYCPNSGPVNYPKGYLSLGTLLKALPYSILNVSFSMHGEPLLHPQVCEFVHAARGSGRKPQISTNGLLLTDVMCRGLIQAGVDTVEIGIYSEKALRNYKRLFDINEEAGNPIHIIGDFYPVHWNLDIEYNRTPRDWIEKLKLEPKHVKPLKIVPMHQWARGPETVWKDCLFVTEGWAAMKWDGRVYSCCYDFEGVNYLGTIDEFPNLKHKWLEYKLCKTCSPSWVHGVNDIWYRVNEVLGIK